MKVSTNWIKDFVKISPPLEKVAEDLTMAGLEVKKIEPVPEQKDTLLEIEITPNRPDWLSHFGVAREIAAVQNLSLKQIETPKTLNRPMPQGWKIQLKDLEACPYYTGVYIEGIQNLSTPDFIKDRLAACGLRSIHVVVDITNYVLLEMGQPLHAFDADLISGQEIQIRRAKSEEKFIAINEASYVLHSQDLVISDSDKAVALAGVMGGKDSEVTTRTRNVFLESAFFHPRFVRQTSRRHGLSSDSSYRFERRVDPQGVDLGRERAIGLIQQYAKPRFVSAVIKAGQMPVAKKTILHLSVAETVKKLGMALKSHQIASILTRLGFDAKQDSTDSVKVEIPSFRADITEPIDLIEEVARIFGYENIPETLPVRAPIGLKQHPIFKVEENVRNLLTGFGCYETVTFSLISEKGLNPERDLSKAVYVNNPQNQELCWMRPSFVPSFLQVMQKNFSWGAQRIPIFEIGDLYRMPEKENYPLEDRWLGIALSGKYREKTWADPGRDFSYYDLKGLVFQILSKNGITNPESRSTQTGFFVSPASEEIFMNDVLLARLGEVHPKIAKQWDISIPVYVAEIALENLSKLAAWDRTYHEVPRYPAIERDLSVTVPEKIHAGEIEEQIRQLGKGLVSQVQVFDLFRGGRIPQGHKNLAFRVHYQSLEKTLVSDEIQKLHSDIADILVRKYHASFQQ